MALQNKREELQAAWRALADYQCAEGWRTIPISSNNSCRLLAGRHFPGNEEALLVGFVSLRIPPAEQLPQGFGFVVSKIDIGVDRAEYSWVALSRNQSGNPDFFALMADDVVTTLEEQSKNNPARLFNIFVSRIRAWQDFMRKGGEEVLSPEAEVGLFGELSIMQDLLNTRIPAEIIVDSWQGPLNGMHDFGLGTGAIEVKTTVSHQGFPAKIGSLDQLDDSLIHPLFISAARLEINPRGMTLPALIHETRAMLESEPAALAGLDSRLLHVGYFEFFAEKYIRRFIRHNTRFIAVKESFPRLTRANVSIEIRQARYEIDLDMIPSGNTELIDVLQQLGVI